MGGGGWGVGGVGGWGVGGGVGGGGNIPHSPNVIILLVLALTCSGHSDNNATWGGGQYTTFSKCYNIARTSFNVQDTATIMQHDLINLCLTLFTIITPIYWYWFNKHIIQFEHNCWGYWVNVTQPLPNTENSSSTLTTQVWVCVPKHILGDSAHRSKNVAQIFIVLHLFNTFSIKLKI